MLGRSDGSEEMGLLQASSPGASSSAPCADDVMPPAGTPSLARRRNWFGEEGLKEEGDRCIKSKVQIGHSSLGGKRMKPNRILKVCIVVLAGVHGASAQGVPGLSPDAKACALLPMADLEAAFGRKASAPRGNDDGPNSVCRVTVGDVAAALQIAAPGTPGAPHSIQEGFLGLRAMAGKEVDIQTKEYGRIGCGMVQITSRLGSAQPVKTRYSTACFLVDGGYLALSIGGEDPKRLSFDVIKQLTEKAAARRNRW
jgi:hypothetical protein